MGTCMLRLCTEHAAPYMHECVCSIGRLGLLCLFMHTLIYRWFIVTRIVLSVMETSFLFSILAALNPPPFSFLLSLSILCLCTSHTCGPPLRCQLILFMAFIVSYADLCSTDDVVRPYSICWVHNYYILCYSTSFLFNLKIMGLDQSPLLNSRRCPDIFDRIIYLAVHLQYPFLLCTYFFFH